MKQILETYLTVFLVMVAVITLTGIIGADIDTKNARDFKESVVSEIENSNFSPSVIQACKDAADDTEYTITINEMKDSYGTTIMAEVIVGYDYSIPFLNVLKNHEIRDFAV